MNFNIKKIWIVVLFAFVILALTNPSAKSFKEYSSAENYFDFSKKYNFLVCSVYSYDGKTYIGALLNFFGFDQKSRIQSAGTIQKEDDKNIPVADSALSVIDTITTKISKKQKLDFGKAFDKAVEETNKEHSR